MNLNAKSIAWDLGKDITHEVLIANLGGYEAAKRYAESRNGADNTGVYDSLQAALLEYRRQHNIFEVGDKVVLKDGYQDNVLTVQEFRDGFIRAFLGDSIKYSFGHAANFRHAEPEELEAGKRLEVV